MHSTILCILWTFYNRPDILRPPRSILIPNAVTSTALSFIMYFIYFRGINEPNDPNSSISGTVPSAKASMTSAPLPALPPDIANSHIAYIEPQGITPVRSPTMRGREAKRRRAPAVTEQNEFCCGMSERRPGSSPHMFMPMSATSIPIIVKAMLFTCIV